MHKMYYMFYGRLIWPIDKSGAEEQKSREKAILALFKKLGVEADSLASVPQIDLVKTLKTWAEQEPKLVELPK